MTSLHLDPPMTLRRVTAANRWVLPAAVVVFVVLGVGAMAGWLVWDEPISRWVVESRTANLDDVFRELSFLGSTKVVILVSAIAALLAARRCPRLALAIIAIALARPATEFLLKEIVSRPRPVGARLVGGEGYSFPSGHPARRGGELGHAAARRSLVHASPCGLVVDRDRRLGDGRAGRDEPCVPRGALDVRRRGFDRAGSHRRRDRRVLRRALALRVLGRRTVGEHAGSGRAVDAHDVGAQAVEGPVLETTA